MKIFTKEWFDAVNERLRANDDLQAAAGSAQLRLQQVVTDNPDGDNILHYVKVGDGVAEVGLGEVDSPDATMTADYASAAAMNKGELDIMAAFSTGKLLVTGNLGALMQHQAVLTQVNGAMEELRDQTEYAG